MKIRSQINVLLLLALCVMPAGFWVAVKAAHEVGQHMSDISAAEDLITSATQLRAVAVETILFHESRSRQQWQSKIASMQKDIAHLPVDSPVERTLRDRIGNNIALAETTWARVEGLALATPRRSAVEAELEARSVNALSVITQEIMDAGYELIRSNRAQATQALNLMQAMVALVMFMTLLFCLTVWMMVARGILAPLSELERGTRYIAEGDYSRRMDLAQRNEIGTLAQAFNLMTGRVQQSQQQLLVAKVEAEQATLAKSEFLANMSHEIRTPMNAILGMLTLVQRTRLDAHQQDYLSKTDAAARSLLGLLNSILDLSKIEAGKMELDPRPFQLDRLMHNLGVILRGNIVNKNVELHFDLDPGLPLWLLGDDMRLEQVLINLGGNAVKFTEQGTVILQVRVLQRQPDQVRLAFVVQDTGIGITPQQQIKIFSSFSQAEASTTRRFGGSGLGLMISRRLIEMMGGQLALHSTPGSGSVFSFELDFKLASGQTSTSEQVPAKAQAAPGRVHQRRLEGMHLLIAEDNPNNQQIALELLSAEGAQIELASNGQEALLRVIMSKPDFDAVLMDLQMPEMDGYEATRLIRQRKTREQLPIIAMTANAMDTDREACFAVGMNEHVGKPFDLHNLVTVLLHHTGRSSANPDPARTGRQAELAATLLSASSSASSAPSASSASSASSAPSASSALPQDLLAQAQQRQIELASALKRLDHNTAIYCQVLQAFIKQAAALADQLAQLLFENRLGDAARLMHTESGLAATLGLPVLAQLGRQVEHELKLANHAADRAPEWVQAVRDGWAMVLPDLLWLQQNLTGACAVAGPVASPDGEARSAAASWRNELPQLIHYLRNGDMAAIDLYARMAADCPQWQTGDLAKSMDALDFAAALACCQAMADE